MKKIGLETDWFTAKVVNIDTLILIANIFFISLSINAPNILVGYGLVIPAMMISIVYTRPLKGALLFFLGHLIATFILIWTASMFTLVAGLSLIVRSLMVLILGYMYENKTINNLLLLLTSIVILDTFISYSIALLYYGHDAIEVGLDIYSAIYIPYIYLSYKYYKKKLIPYSITLILAMILYYFSVAYFYAAALNILSIAIPIMLLSPGRPEDMKKILGLLLAAFVMLTPLSMPFILYNTIVITYPYNPASWMGTQWNQTREGGFCKPGNVFEHVYDPARLRILDTCVTIRGVVVSEITIAADGDVTFDVKLDPPYQHMLSIGSYILRNGAIHVEIVPYDRDAVLIPKKGDYVEITGVWVVDTDHGSWSEIHPAWSVVVIEYNATST